MKKILLADDNEIDRMLYRRFLGKQLGHESLEFHEATSGEQAIALYKSLRPDCMLLDYNLQDIDGLTVLEQCRQHAPSEGMCVVMITGSGNEKLAVRALNGGASDYLVKGQFDRELLAKTITHAIEKTEWQHYQSRYHTQLQAINQQLRDSLTELTDTRQQLQVRNQELANTNRELARTNADLDNFVYAASHDLRQPVHNLQGLFDELRRVAIFPDPEDAQVLRLVDVSLQALTTTITDLATVVQEQRATGNQAPEHVNIRELMAEVASSLRAQIRSTQAHIRLEVEEVEQVEYVRANLRTILQNLTSNALKYRHPDRRPEVTIRTCLQAGQPVVEVQDNGLGIDMSRHGAELFQLFRRFHPGVEGTGVGLFLVNRLVLTGGGHVEVDSQEGEGTTFRVYLRQEG
ncbi:sensor histidine kinase [Hymenobacter metallilatus]|uniref:histidine kinase n=1 Tax=Hymenobacter metallilatus TaxID=2493666 RepID=A0A3R9N0L0_9BACT|nr:hybrid sensor histidine kinase/response regulator [Hymenobacter metallilatus]RSK35443.1 hybrid sensor histidine kinase/response regulator [Hymenobacter metallilatus]